MIAKFLIPSRRLVLMEQGSTATSFSDLLSEFNDVMAQIEGLKLE
jgi:hypothetical protein